MTKLDHVRQRIGRVSRDPALRHTALNQLVRLALGPVMLVALPVFLTAEQLGYWYAMTGIAAILAFADLGISAVVMQMSAHEHASGMTSKGDIPNALLRQDALLLFALRRIGLVALVSLPAVFAVGLFFMANEKAAEGMSWAAPWGVYCLGAAVALVLSVLLAFREGQAAVGTVQALRAAMAFTTLLVTVGGVALGLGLWALPAASIAASTLGLLFLARQHFPGLARLRAVPATAIRDWATELSPLMGRYNLTWIGGYLMFQLFAPLAIYFEGPVFAGRVGLTVAIFTSLFTLANVWTTFRLPLLSIAVASRDGAALRNIFATGLLAALATYIAMATTVLVVFTQLKDEPAVSARVLSLSAFWILAVSWGMQVLVQNGAQLLRAFKVEPLVLATWLAALHTVGGTLVLLYLDRRDLMFLALATSYIWVLPVVVVLTRRRFEEIAMWSVASGHLAKGGPARNWS